ncbi:hypothetical protein [Flavobacterium sp. GCM10027622]|uniref:hypothetical protein n=1 Tax=unclassified Flavobacterium TaxID=196869 RepID=UPI00361E75B3
MSRESKRGLAFATLKNKGLVQEGAKLTDTVKYIVVDISGAGGIFPIMDSNTKKKVGVCNFDGNKLNVGRHLVIDGIKIEKATAGSTPETAQFSGNTTLPPELSNTEFRVKQGESVPIDISTSDLNQRADSTYGIKYREFTTAPVLVANEEMEMYLHFPASVAAPANTIIKVSFNCHQIKGDK